MLTWGAGPSSRRAVHRDKQTGVGDLMRIERAALSASALCSVFLLAANAFAAPNAGRPIAQNAPQAEPPAPKPDAMEEARARYRRGVELFNEGDYKLALIEFQRSFALSPNWRI